MRLMFLLFFLPSSSFTPALSLYSFLLLQLFKIRDVLFLCYLIPLHTLSFSFGSISESRAALSSLALGRQTLCPALHLISLPDALLTSGLWDLAKSRTRTRVELVRSTWLQSFRKMTLKASRQTHFVCSLYWLAKHGVCVHYFNKIIPSQVDLLLHI